MKQYLTKRNIIIAAVAIVLLAVIVVAVVLQLGTEIPKLTFDCGTLEQKETGMFYTEIPVDWRGGNKEARERAKIANAEGYFAAMENQAGCVMYSGRKINFSFEEETPEYVTLNIYDQNGLIVNTIPMNETYSFTAPDGFDPQLYVLEAIFEQGTCAYAFWMFPL